MECMLVVWGSGHNPQRQQRLEDMRMACEPRGHGTPATLRNIANLEKCQRPLMDQSESYRTEVTSSLCVLKIHEQSVVFTSYLIVSSYWLLYVG
jgi:hypothetical protein